MALEDVLAAIYPLDGKTPKGAGLLVGHNLILTCAHVVNEALGRGASHTGRPEGQVRVKLHVSPHCDCYTACVDSADDAWNDPPDWNDPFPAKLGADLCLLRLDTCGGNAIEYDALQNVKSVTLADVRNRKLPIEFGAAGYPEGWDVDVAMGEIVFRQAAGLYMLRPYPTVLASTARLNRSLWEAARPPGLIHSGFSGGPVEVEGRVVGLITQARERVSDATAYMIPVSAFHNASSQATWPRRRRLGKPGRMASPESLCGGLLRPSR